MKAKLGILLLGVALAAGVLFTIQWRDSNRALLAIEENLPDLPNTATQDERLAQRLSALDGRVRNEGEIKAYRELGKLYHANGYLNEAWAVYRGLVFAEPKEARWPHLLARILAGYGRLEEAIPLFKRAVTLEPEYLPSRIHLGNAHFKVNQIEEAEKVFREALKIEPENLHALVGLARVDIARGDWESARDRLLEVTRNSGYKIGSDLLADVYEALGDRSKSRAARHNSQWGSFSDIADPWVIDLMNESYDPYQVAIAGGWVDHAGDRELGIELLRRSVFLDPGNPMNQYQLGNLYLAEGALGEARKAFARSIELRPDFADAWLGLIRIEESRGDASAANALLRRAFQSCPDSPSMNIRMGSHLLDQSRVDEAIPYFEKAIEKLPHEAGGYLQLARAYFQLGKEEAGVEEMGKALNAEPSNPLALMTLARYRISKGDESLAEDYLNRCVGSPRISERELELLVNAFRSTFGRKPVLR